MPEVEQQSPATVPGASELGASEGSRNAGTQGNVSPDPSTAPTSAQSSAQGETSKELELINEVSGRKYATLDEAKKGLKETYTYVGTLGQQAARFDKLAEKIAKENNVAKEVAVQYLEELAAEQQAQETAAANPVEGTASQPEVKPNLQERNTDFLAEKVNELEFLRKYPQAEQHTDVIRTIHRATGKDFAAIYEETIVPLVNQGKKDAYATQESKTSSGTAVGSGEAPVTDTYQEVFDDFAKNPSRENLMGVLKAKGLKIVAE